MAASDERRARAARRQREAVLHKTTLQRIEHDLSPVGGPAAVSLVTQLTKESWSAAGHELPRYSRSDIPHRFVPGRRG